LAVNFADEPSLDDIPPFLRTEWQAESFASAFIAPLDAVVTLHDQLGRLKVGDLTRAFGFSTYAAEVRIRTARRLTARPFMETHAHADQLRLTFDR
jgi:hypothetical protein